VASENGHGDARVDPSVIIALRKASKNGHTEVVKVLQK